MLRYALMAVGAALLVALVFVLLPVGGGRRPEPRILASGDTPAATSFTVHDATATPAPSAALTPAVPPPDLDAVIGRLRTAGNTATPDAPAIAPTATPPTAAPPAPPIPPAAPPVPDPAATPPAPPPARMQTVTAQGTRWRLARSGTGYTISIDIGGGQIADVHVLPAFANLDPAAINVRVDYLRETILQSFPHQNGPYTFARDGSVSLER